MAARKAARGDLSAKVQSIFADAVEQVQAVVKAALADELSKVIGSGGKLLGGGARRGRKPGRKAAGGASGEPGRPGRKPSYTPEHVDRLVDLVKAEGELAPKDARKKLKVSNTQLHGMVKLAVGDGRIKVVGAGRGTRYTRV